MITRTWRGRVRTERAQEYVGIVERTGMAGYRSTPGNRGAQVLTRDLGDGSTEIVTLSWWDDLDVVRGFAGDDLERARYYPEDDDFLLERDPTVSHHEVAPPSGPGTRSETETLLAYLDRLRRDLVRDLSDLTEEQARRPMVPSGTSLLGIVHHLTGVEEHWFERVFAGQDRDPDRSFAPPEGLSTAEVVARYEQVWERSDRVARGSHPEALAAVPDPGEEGLDALRSVLVHLVEETARHVGRADILRELLDGRTND
jgi:uncharacterized damage-inducible protein DinB/heme-degrading monooxygenase HmoA